MKIEELIPKDIIPYFSEIANRLWSGHAAIMIGAGFSKNAKKSESTKKSFPDWNKLGDVFYKKIHGTYPTNKGYLNVLKLADEVQAAFGRNTLDQILKHEIPDKEYQPSQLHERTMQLPWTDVFTTNYDTLLERTADKILQYKYETVINKNDLVLSTKPRIIKLHGSFPSERPYIITEEDYRKYPYEFAPFVNTVQQSLLENTLCLIGFSGDDPNFLKWIGWIRDNLGKENSPKIYLIGILSLSIGQKRLLEERNIIPIDLSGCKGIDGSHEKSLTLFIDFLHGQSRVEESLGWPEYNKQFHSISNKDINEQISPIIENWRSIRLKYPDWLIVPEDRRNVLQIYTESGNSFVYNLSKANSPIDIEFLFEYNWRIEKSLSPIGNNIIIHYNSVVNKYNPFPDILDIEDALTPRSKNQIGLDWGKITIMWLSILLSMLRYYREEGVHKEWGQLNVLLKKLINKLNPESLANYYYERCLYHIFSLNIESVRKELDEWPTDFSLPYWEAKKAGLLAEMGEVIEAERILETALKEVRSSLNLSPIVNNYLYVSQEAYILQLLKYVKSSTRHLQRIYSNDESANKDYSERWNTLMQYKCDPWAELELFNIYLEKEPNDVGKLEKTHGFDFGVVTTTQHYGDKYTQKAYSYLRYIEDLGIPYRLPGMKFGEKAAKGAISQLANYSPYWAMASFMRSGNKKITDTIFGRKSLSKMYQVQVDRLIDEYLTVLDKSKNEIKKGDPIRNKNFAVSLSTTIPEVLSRLCLKSSFDVKKRLIHFLKEVFNSEIRDRYAGINLLTSRLMRSFSESEQYSLIPTLLEFNILPKLNHREKTEFEDPFRYIERSKKVLSRGTGINIKTINQLFETGGRTPKERETAITRLVILFELNFLSEAHMNQLGELIWSRIDKNTGFPVETNYYNFAFITLPHPSNINPSHLLKKYISTSTINVQANKKKKGIEFFTGEIPLFREINGTSNKNISYIWEKRDLNLLAKKIIEWWDADKKYLLEKESRSPFGSIRDEFKARFNHLISIFSNILSPNYNLLEKQVKIDFARVIDELPNYKLSNLRIKSALYNFLPKKQLEIRLSLYNNIFSWSKQNVSDSLQGIIKLLEVSPESTSELINAIGENIRSLNITYLYDFLYVITIIIEQYPELIEERLLENLEIGLTNLIEETKISDEDSSNIIDLKLSNKQQAAYLTVALNNYWESKKTIPREFIQKWKDLCLVPDEFSELRRIWKNV